MSSRLNPYLNFDGDARAALELYRDVFGGTLTISTFGEFGAPEGVDPDGVMHGQLDTPSGYTLMASDLPPGAQLSRGASITICLSGDDAEELRGYFTRLAEGGSVSVPLEKQMWGDEFGQCEDRFGVGWLVNIGPAQG